MTQGDNGHLQNQGAASVELTLPTTSSWTSSFQNREKTRFCCLRPRVSQLVLAA